MQVITTQSKGIEKIQFSKYARHVFFWFSQVQKGLVQNTCEIPYIYLPVSMSGWLPDIIQSQFYLYRDSSVYLLYYNKHHNYCALYSILRFRQKFGIITMKTTSPMKSVKRMKGVNHPHTGHNPIITLQ